jgi:hypothetical protein
VSSQFDSGVVIRCCPITQQFFNCHELLGSEVESNELFILFARFDHVTGFGELNDFLGDESSGEFAVDNFSDGLQTCFSTIRLVKRFVELN